jgi:hypothetical protein
LAIEGWSFDAWNRESAQTTEIHGC